MKEIHVERRGIDLAEYKNRAAAPSDYSHVIKESAIIKEDGETKIIYLKLPFDSTDIVAALHRIKFETTYRTNGLKTTSRIFGFKPRSTMRSDYCTAAKLAGEMPKEHDIICEYAGKVAEHYKSLNPKYYAQHAKRVKESVIKDYQLSESPFTSGIVNKNNAIKYHFDTGNFDKVWSCMLGFKHRVKGGYLCIPQYGIALEIDNNTATMFDGQGLMHGVTPIKYLGAESYRYTIVYYSLKQMWNCDPITDEVIRIRKLKTEREIKRAGL